MSRWLLAQSIPFYSLILLILFSKFYFLWGFSPGTKNPLAPNYLVIVRDLAYFVFLAFFVISSGGIQFFKGKIFRDQKWLLFHLLFLGLLGWESSGPKSALEVIQHYVRNFYLPTFSCIFFLNYLERSSSEKLVLAKNHLRRALEIFAIASLCMSLIQLPFFPKMMWETRPTGFLGDPLLNSCFIFLGIFSLLSGPMRWGFKFLWSSLALLVLYKAFSMSAILAFILSIFLSILISPRLRNSIKRQAFSNWKMGALGATLLAGIIGLLIQFAPQFANRDATTIKIQSVWNSVSCTTDCDTIHPSIEGRLRAYKAIRSVCESSPVNCFFGDRSNEVYYRVDSMYSSLIINYGLIFFSVYILLFFVLPLRALVAGADTYGTLFSIIFFLYWIFGIFNTSFYKHPLNILFYLTCALFLQKPRSDSTNHTQK